jgi:uncharacterized protein YbbK (DUF523 family)
MRLPHHQEALNALRSPTVEDPWRVLMSGCLFGWKVAVTAEGKKYGLDGLQPTWLDSPLVKLVAFCPEDYKLGTPRQMPDLHGGDGFDVLDGTARVLDPDGNDFTAAVLAGAEAMASLAREQDVDFALLTDRSGSCGSQVISVGCRLEGPVEYRKGVGVAAALLLREGVHIVSQRDFQTLEVLRSKVEPGYEPNQEALDHHEHPWVVEHLP